MSEKIIYTPSRVIPIAPSPGDSTMNSATHSPSFAEFLAEAEAVQDVVQVGAIPANGIFGAGMLGKDRVGPAMAGLRNQIQCTLRSMAGLVRGPMPRWVMTLRDEKLRRNGTRG